MDVDLVLANVGVSHFHVGLSHSTVGVSHFHVGLPHSNVGVSHFHVGLPHSNVGVTHFHVDLPLSNVGVTHFHVDLWHSNAGEPYVHVGEEQIRVNSRKFAVWLRRSVSGSPDPPRSSSVLHKKGPIPASGTERTARRRSIRLGERSLRCCELEADDTGDDEGET